MVDRKNQTLETVVGFDNGFDFLSFDFGKFVDMADGSSVAIVFVEVVAVIVVVAVDVIVVVIVAVEIVVVAFVAAAAVDIAVVVIVEAEVIEEFDLIFQNPPVEHFPTQMVSSIGYSDSLTVEDMIAL